MTRSTFADHFSAVAANYADFRPTYPPALFSWLATLTPAHDLAWDCAAGSGQASVDLARHFARVLATDASAQQIATTQPHPQIEYRIAPAEASGLSDASVDLLTVAQALHWFDLHRFYAEALRVLKPAGVLAAWTYGVLIVDDAQVDARVQTFYCDTIGPYWPPERAQVESGYRNLPFPVPEIAAPALRMETTWNLAQLLGYLRSWSATARYVAAHASDPVAALAQELAPLWGDPAQARRIAWPLSLRVGRKPA
jgi:ubiquinone/menaquinone biosynthesis C-methylase UbiE